MNHKKELQRARKKLNKLELSTAKIAYKEDKFAIIVLKDNCAVRCTNFKFFKKVYKSEYKDNNVRYVVYRFKCEY